MKKIEKYKAIEEILSDYHLGLFTDAFYITKLVELMDKYQSPKQPEGCEHDFNCDGYCVKCHIRDMQVEESKIEKQEGEGEELDLKKEIAKIFAEEEVALLLADSLQEKLVDFISQLLSERTFSKEELEWILSFIFGEGTRPRDGMGMKVLEKISKLLNEKEDEQI